MPGHIGTGIVMNTWRIHAGAEPADMDDAQLAATRDALRRQGVPLDGVADEQLRAGLAMMGQAFRDTAPMSAAEAATVILDGVRADRWRILVGEDAEQIDVDVRADPLAAYEGGVNLTSLRRS
jgi:hypothetical protein